MRHIGAIVMAVCSACGAWAGANGVDFVVREAGKAERRVRVSAVRHAPNAPKLEISAAWELALYLELMTGVKLSVGAGGTPANDELRVGRLAIEQKAFSEEDLRWIGTDGYCVSVLEDGIALAGAKPRGTLYGAYRFLEDLGCRFFTADCERVPKVEAPVLDYSSKRERPSFALRTIGSAKQGGGDVYYSVANPLAGLPPEEAKLYPRLWLDHTAGYLVPTWKYFDAHPEYFAHSPEGKVLFDIGTQRSALNPFGEDIVRKRTDMVWLCTSNPDVRRIAAERLLEWISRQPDHPFFCVQQGDSNFPCQCERCAAVGNVTDNLVAFANSLGEAVKEKFPDRTLLIFAYGNTMTLPKIRPADNVCVLFAPIHASSRMHSCLSPERNPETREQFLRWHEFAPNNMGIYEYNMDANAPCLDKMISAIEEYARLGVRGIFYCGAVSMMPDLFTYVNAQLLWNSRRDPDALIREFCEGYYGAAGPHIEAFVKLKRRQVNAVQPVSNEYGARLGPSFYTLDFSAEAAALLGKATEAVTGDRRLSARVWTIRKKVLTGILEAWDWTDPAVSEAARASYGGYLADYLRMTIRMNDQTVKVPEFLRNVAHLRVADAWQDDPFITFFLEDPAGMLEKELPNVLASFLQEVPGGWQLLLEAFRGGTGPVYYRWMCPGKMMKGTYGRGSGLESMRARFVLGAVPGPECDLVVEGQDPGNLLQHTKIRISLNDRVLFEGPNRCVSCGWSQDAFPIPRDTLRKGQNILTIENLEDSRRRWFIVSDVRILRRDKRESSTNAP